MICRKKNKVGALIGKRVAIRISDPWDFGEEIGWAELSARIIRTLTSSPGQDALILELSNPIKYRDTECLYFVASPRLERNDYSDLKSGGAVLSNLTRITRSQLDLDDPFDLSAWRGGVGIIAELREA